MTTCYDCGTSLRSSSVRVVVLQSEIAVVCCVSCSTARPGETYQPTGVPARNRYDLSKRGRA